MNSKEIIRLLEADGWIKHAQKGSHCQYKHLTKKGKVNSTSSEKGLPNQDIQKYIKTSGLN